MVCSKCDKENKEGAIHCGGCGEKLPISRTCHTSKALTAQNPSAIDQTSKNIALETSTEKTYCAGCHKEKKETDDFCGGCGEALFINFTGAVRENDENRIISSRIYEGNQDIVADTTEDVIHSNGRPTQRTPSQIRTENRNSIDVIYLLIIIIPLLIAFFMLFGAIGNVRKDVNNKPPVSVMTDRMLIDIENEINETKHRIKQLEEELKQKLSNVVEPGPEPWRIFFLEHWEWEKKKELRNGLENKIELVELAIQRERDNLKVLFKDKAKQIALIDDGPGKPIRDFFKYIWDTFIGPVLHFLLIWAIFIFSLNSFCRFLLIKGRLGVTKL